MDATGRGVYQIRSARVASESGPRATERGIGARAARTLSLGEASPSDSTYPSYPTVREKVSAFFPMPKNDDMVACPAGALSRRRRFCTSLDAHSDFRPSLPRLDAHA